MKSCRKSYAVIDAALGRYSFKIKLVRSNMIAGIMPEIGSK